MPAGGQVTEGHDTDEGLPGDKKKKKKNSAFPNSTLASQIRGREIRRWGWGEYWLCPEKNLEPFLLPDLKPEFLISAVVQPPLLHLCTLSTASSQRSPISLPQGQRGMSYHGRRTGTYTHAHTVCTSTRMYVTHVRTFFNDSQRESTVNPLPFMD